MNTTALAQGLTSLHHVLTQVRPTPGAALHELTGTQLRDLCTSLLDTFAALRETLADTTDSRLALELAATAQQLGFEATRMDLVAAERATATAAHTLAQSELDALREHPADTTSTPARASGRACYRNPDELLASWTRTPYWHTHPLLAHPPPSAGSMDLVGQGLHRGPGCPALRAPGRPALRVRGGSDGGATGQPETGQGRTGGPHLLRHRHQPEPEACRRAHRGGTRSPSPGRGVHSVRGGEEDRVPDFGGDQPVRAGPAGVLAPWGVSVADPQSALPRVFGADLHGGGFVGGCVDRGGEQGQHAGRAGRADEPCRGEPEPRTGVGAGGWGVVFQGPR